MKVAEKNGMLGGAANTEIGLGFELRTRPFHARVWRGNDLDIKLQIAQKRRIITAALFGRNQSTCGIEPFGESRGLTGKMQGNEEGNGG